MSASGTRASELAAQQVEQIVAAAQEAAEEIRREARRELEDLRRSAEQDGEDLLERARRDAQKLLDDARKDALLLGNDARREAEALIADAREECERAREQTQRAVQGRVAAAEKAAADVLEEARALSSGLHQLGKSLEGHAERILRDVTAAHKRMQADLRVDGASSDDGYDPATPSSPASPRSAPARKAAANRSDDGRRDGELPSGGSSRPNPLGDLEVPSWVGDRS